MAPENMTSLDHVQESIKDVIQDLFQILAQVSMYDSAGRPTREALAQDLQDLSTTLLSVHNTAATLAPAPPAPPVNNNTSSSRSSPSIPEPLIQYVENGRNPDIYTREFVELVRRLNQLVRGKMHAFGGFRDVLARDMCAAMPELRDDVRRVLEATGGVAVDVKNGELVAAGGGER